MTMASGIYDSFLDNILNATFDLATATVKGLLVSNSYTPNFGTDQKRSDANADEVAGTGYAAGGAASTVTIAKDTTNHRSTIGFANIVWTSSTITARGIVLYNARGGLATADELIAAATFGADVSSSASDFTAVNTAPILYQN